MRKDYLFAFVSIFFWSTVAVTSKTLLESLTNIEVLFASSFIAGIFIRIKEEKRL